MSCSYQAKGSAPRFLEGGDTQGGSPLSRGSPSWPRLRAKARHEQPRLPTHDIAVLSWWFAPALGRKQKSFLPTPLGPIQLGIHSLMARDDFNHCAAKGHSESLASLHIRQTSVPRTADFSKEGHRPSSQGRTLQGPLVALSDALQGTCQGCLHLYPYRGNRGSWVPASTQLGAPATQSGTGAARTPQPREGAAISPLAKPNAPLEPFSEMSVSFLVYSRHEHGKLDWNLHVSFLLRLRTRH